MTPDTLAAFLLRPEVGWFVVTLFGAAAMYVFSVQKGMPGATLFLRKMAPGKSEVFYDRVDFVIVVMFGSVIGYIFFRPVDALASLAAGFGWVGAMNVLLSPPDQTK